MSRTKIVAGNWKMNKTFNEAVELVNDVISNSAQNSVIKIFFPPFPFVNKVAELVASRNDVFAGAQNCSEHSAGAFTGEVSAAMIDSIGAKYVLAGHSERRHNFGETNPVSRKKITLALENNLKVIYCIGETLAERKAGSHFDVVKTQLTEAIQNIAPKNLIIAYEPVWAIGTGETATPAQAQEMHAFIRGHLKELYDPATSENFSILYGGSCNAQNAKELFACKDIDGGLIGGASLKAEDFCRIIASF
jgi:triosephosphate isomerase (TIM)